MTEPTRRGFLKLFAAAPLIAGAVATDVLTPPAKAEPPPLLRLTLPKNSTRAEREAALRHLQRISDGPCVVLEPDMRIEYVHAAAVASCRDPACCLAIEHPALWCANRGSMRAGEP